MMFIIPKNTCNGHFYIKSGMKIKARETCREQAENLDWRSSLFFYEEEIAIMQRRIREIIKANNSTEILAQTAHFQTQLIIQKGIIEMLKDNMDMVERSAEAPDPEAGKRNAMDFEQNFNKLRKELGAFLLQWI